MNPLQRKLLFAAGICLFAYIIYSSVDMVRQEKTREVARQFGAAYEQAEKAPPGLERGQAFLKELRAIQVDTTLTPSDVQRALNAYIVALEHGLDALRVGKVSPAADQELAAAKKAFHEAVRHNLGR